MPQQKLLKTYWRHRKVSVVDWSQCLVDGGCRDKPVFSDDDDSTHGMHLRSRNKEIAKDAGSLGKDFSSDEDPNFSHEDLYSFDKQETCQDACVVGKGKKRKCKRRKAKEEQRQKGETRTPVKWAEINFSDIEQHSLIISNSPLIEGYLEPAESPEPVRAEEDDDHHHRNRLVLDPVPVLCSTPHVDARRRNGRSDRDEFSENLSDVSGRTLPPSTIDLSYQSEKGSFCTDGFRAPHGFHEDCSLGDASVRLSVQHDASSRGVCGLALTPAHLTKTTESQLSHHLGMENSMDMFSCIRSRSAETLLSWSGADESISKAQMSSSSTHEIHDANGEVVVCRTDQVADDTLNETEESKCLSHCLSRIMEEEDEEEDEEAMGSESKDDRCSDSEDKGGNESENKGGSESEDEGGNESDDEAATTSVMSCDAEDVIGGQKCDVSIDRDDRIRVDEPSEHDALHGQMVTPGATRVHGVQSVGGGGSGFFTPPSKMPSTLQEALQRSARNMKAFGFNMTISG